MRLILNVGIYDLGSICLRYLLRYTVRHVFDRPIYGPLFCRSWSTLRRRHGIGVIPWTNPILPNYACCSFSKRPSG